MIKKIIILLFIILVIKTTSNICNNIDISYNQVRDINRNQDYNYTIGPLPYSNKKFYNK